MRRRAPAAAVPVTALAAALVLLTGCSAGQSPAPDAVAPPAPPAPPAAPGSPAASAEDTAVPTLRPSAPTSSGTTAAAAHPAGPSPVGAVIDLSYAGGGVSGDTGRVRLRSGEPVTLRVTSDVTEEVHVHGVDLYVDLAPGRTATARFAAPPPGVYELELHDSGTVLTRMQVT